MVDIKITNTTIINASLVVQDSVMQTWIIDSNASFHCTPKECFLSFFASNFGKVYLGNNQLGVVRVAMENSRELTTIDQIRFVSRIKNNSMSVGQLDLQCYSTIFIGGEWKVIHGT